MKLQRIVAKDSRSANEQAIAKYGRDVLVVSNSRVNGMTELIVAVDVEPEAMPAPQMPKGAGEPFEAALRGQLHRGAQISGLGATGASGAAALAHATASASAGIAGGEPADSGEAAFVPAHMALMQAAQRAAAQTLAHTEAARESQREIPRDPSREPQHEPQRQLHRDHRPAPQADSRPAGSGFPAADMTRSPAQPVLRYTQQFNLGSIHPVGVSTLSFAGLSAPAGRTDPPAARGTASETAHIQPIGRPVTPHPIDDDLQAPALVALIRDEIAALRKEMRMGQQLQAWAAQGPSHRWNEALTEVGVPTPLRALLLSGLSNDFDDEQALQSIEQQMQENLPTTPRPGSRGKRSAQTPWTSGTHLLCGPTGSGKTSMAARLAHEAAQRLGVERVVLISWNDTRPGAWGQLQLWASRIGVAVFRAADTATLELLMQEHRGQLILVDTGLSQPDILREATLGLDALHHLVMPADATAASLRRWIGEQAPAWQDILVTRLDESAQPWPLLQMCCDHHLAPIAASEGSGLTHLRSRYDAAHLLQHSMTLLAAQFHGQTAEPLRGSAGLSIPTIEEISTVVPPRQAGRSGRSSGGVKATAATRTRNGVPHA